MKKLLPSGNFSYAHRVATRAMRGNAIAACQTAYISLKKHEPSTDDSFFLYV